MYTEKDYVMRMIRQLIQMLLGEIIKGKERNIEEDINELKEQSEKYNKLKELVDDYKINEAENILFDNSDINNIKDFEIALLFYQYVNEKEDSFLLKSDYTRDEIEQGITDISEKYGYENIVELFLK